MTKSDYKMHLGLVLGGRRRPSPLLFPRVLAALLRLERVTAASAVAHGAGRVQVRNPSKREVLELLQEILATLRGGVYHLLQSELDLEIHAVHQIDLNKEMKEIGEQFVW